MKRLVSIYIVTRIPSSSMCSEKYSLQTCICRGGGSKLYLLMKLLLSAGCIVYTLNRLYVWVAGNLCPNLGIHSQSMLQNKINSILPGRKKKKNSQTK